MAKTCIGVAVAALLVLFSRAAVACEGGNVREAAFMEDRDVHVLCVIASADDASADGTSVDAIYDRLAEWQIEHGSALNISLERLDPEDPDVRWGDYGMPSAPPEVPVTALIGRFAAQRRAFVVDHWEPAPTDEDLAVLLESPVRVAMKERMVDVWATLLHAPGTPGHEGTKSEEELRGLFDAVSERWAEEQSPGIQVVRLSRTDSEERTLRAFAGIPETGPDWVGVIFGKGKLMAPPLEGDDITENKVNRLLESLATPCTCLAEVTVQGVDVPMTWGSDMQAKLSSLPTTTGYVELTIGEATVVGPGGVDVTPEVKERLDEELAQLEAEVPGQRAQVWASVLLPLVTVATLGLGVVLVAVARKKKGTSQE
jgi:hypothetical protein